MLHTPGPQRGPLTRQERWAYAIFLIVLLGLFAGEVIVNYQPVKLSVLFFLLFWIPLLVLHEISHAIVAALVGWRVETIVIGMGRQVCEFKIRHTRIDLRILPLEGFVRSLPTNLICPGQKHALIYFAGPAIELAIAGFVLMFLTPEQLFHRTDNYTVIAWQSLAAASAVGGILNLIPHAIQSGSGIIPNDGLGILLSLSRPASAYANLITERQAGRDHS